MQRSLFLVALLATAVLMTGCPVGLDYAPGTPGSTKIEKASGLIGTWRNTKPEDGEIIRMKIEKQDPYSFVTTVLERGSMYALETDNFTTWVTQIGEVQVSYSKPENEDKYYLYAWELRSDGLHTWDISLKVGGVDACTSSDALIEEIKASMSYDDFLSSEQVYVRD